MSNRENRDVPMSAAGETVAVDWLIQYARNLRYPDLAELLKTIQRREGDGVVLGLAVTALKHYTADDRVLEAWTSNEDDSR
jgi:hypothetical protein